MRPAPPDTVSRAVTLLADAYRTATAKDQPPEQLAYSVLGLERQGVTQTALRWLLDQDLAAHLRETTSHRSRVRTFVRCRNTCFRADSCLILTRTGWQQTGRYASDEPDARSPRVPSWDADLGVLRVGDVVVKRLTREAESLTALLGAFQTAAWPELIPNPLRSEHGVDARDRLRNAVKRLNHRPGPVWVRFRILRSATAVRWEALTGPVVEPASLMRRFGQPANGPTVLQEPA